MQDKNQTSSALPIPNRDSLYLALPMGQMKDFKLKDNYMSALLYSQGWASGDVELMKTIQVLHKDLYLEILRSNPDIKQKRETKQHECPAFLSN